MDYKIKIEQKYLAIPIYAEAPEELLEIFLGDEKVYEFRVPLCQDPKKQKTCDYFSYLNMTEYAGQELTLRGAFEEQFYQKIEQCETKEYEPLLRPLLHFTAERGWINDPNGLVYHNGQYHLYFQYNPMNTQWQNMSWGHSVSENLLQFRQLDTVMYPDADGTIFSGCGLVNDKGLLDLPKDALLFFYSAAAGSNEWSKGGSFTQKIAYSLDEGETLVKLPQAAIGVIRQDTRDPKIFWHEETKAYIMVLWIEGNEFGIFRSVDLQNWEQSDRFVLEKAWECPDLFCLDCEGEPVWVFTSADGFYYLGTFDGYRFTTDGERHYAYQTALPYAAQSYSNTEGRTISIPWLRTKNAGRLYTGMMGIPRELKLVKRSGRTLLSMLPVREYETTKKQIADFNWDGSAFAVSSAAPAAAEVELRPQWNGSITVELYGQSLVLSENKICFNGTETVLEEPMEEIHIIIDREIIEVHANEGTVNAYYETGSDVLQGSIRISGCKGSGKLFIWQP